MKVFTTTQFEGVYPTSTAAVIVAATKAGARKVLERALKERSGLHPGDASVCEMVELDLTTESCAILCDGDY